MTLLLPKTAFRPGLPTDPLDRRIGLARLSLAAERVLPALWPALGFVGLYLTLALFGFFAVIPWTAQALLLAATITATSLSLYFALEDVRWPRGRDAARRLERDNDLMHRPISERDDVIAGGATDAFAQALWRQHRIQALAAAGLKVCAPRPSLDRRDPKNLRYILLIALAAGLVVAHGRIGPRLFSAIDSGAGLSASIDAWVDPPAYTGLPLMSLAGRAGQRIAVPAGSVINLRVHGAMRLPGLLAGWNRTDPFTGDNGEYASNTRLTHDTHLRVRVGGHVVGRWDIVATPDIAPTIAFTAAPSATLRDAVKFSFRAGDDYGVANVRAVLTPHGRGGAPLTVDLPLEQNSAKTLEQASYTDLTGHPYAGLMVDAHLEARDALGQVGVSRTVTFRLPARVFTDPLARALIEQRQNLATAGQKGRQTVAATLDALTIAPELFFDGKASAYTAIRAAYWGTRNARGPDDIAHVEDLLWQTAVALERGGLLTAAEELRKLQQMLNAALASGAPQDVIDELLKRYNDAMQRYLQALAANPPPPGAPEADARTVSPQDIQNLLNVIQQLAKSGAREQAAQMMAVLQNMLENMHVSQGAGSGSGNGQNKALNDAIQKFGEMMGKQRGLLDKTMRQQNGQADPKDGGPQGLAGQQGQLQKELNDALKSIDPKLAGKLGGAGKAMGEAQKSLGAHDLPNAGSAQTQALEALRRGAQALAEEAARQSGQQGQQSGREDPLGRSSGGVGATVKIPDASDLARARAILEELRKRAGEMGRSQQERDYIDRLLKAF